MSQAKRAIDVIGKTGLRPDEVIDYMVQVQLLGEDTSEIFRRVRETLQRIGLTSESELNTLYQSCHILHKKGLYYISHFKMMFVLDGRENRVSEADIARQNRVVKILEGWGMIKVVNPHQLEGCEGVPNGIKILRHEERDDWSLKPKYLVGNVRPLIVRPVEVTIVQPPLLLAA